MPRRVLDLFCGAGGAAMGLHRAWPWAEIIGVDVVPQKHYPFTFVQTDALQFPIAGFDFIWASPPCQEHTPASNIRKAQGYKYRSFIEATRERLCESAIPYAIENVLGSPLGVSLRLCGLMFGLPLLRHRYFETSFAWLAPPHIRHSRGMALRGEVFTVTGHTGGARKDANGHNGGRYRLATAPQARKAMGIEWMSRIEIAQAVPPAYSEFIARQVRFG
ncbi:MAG: class I SAM-dependent methyltransferase [Burkholderiales bacterium]